MKLGFEFKQALSGSIVNNPALQYVSAQLASKATAAIAQLYAIYVFSKILPLSDAALIFILLGYGIWIQVFEFGLSQVIQNALNLKKITVSGICKIISLHYLLMIFFTVLVVIFPEKLNLFQGERQLYGEDLNRLAFPSGVALLLVSTNNVLVIRLLLVTNLAMVASKLAFYQGIFSIFVLMLLKLFGASLFDSVFIYLSIPILTFAPLAIKIARKSLRNRKKPIVDLKWMVTNSIGFWGLTAMSSIYMGADYFFAARHLTNEEMIAYHFASRLFFISYVAYFAFVQYKAKSISSETCIGNPQQIWVVAKNAVAIGVLCVFLVLLLTIFLDRSGGLELIGADGLVVMPLIISATIYYGARVFRDVGLVIIWNMGRQRLLYVVHMLEVMGCLIMLNILTPELGGAEIFFAMGLVAAFSAAIIYGVLCRVSPSSS
jgi:hypothetical protein